MLLPYTCICFMNIYFNVHTADCDQFCQNMSDELMHGVMNKRIAIGK